MPRTTRWGVKDRQTVRMPFVNETNDRVALPGGLTPGRVNSDFRPFARRSDRPCSVPAGSFGGAQSATHGDGMGPLAFH